SRLTFVERWHGLKVGKPKDGTKLYLFDRVEVADGQAVVEFHDRDEQSGAGPSIVHLGRDSSIHVPRYKVGEAEGGKAREVWMVIVRGIANVSVSGWAKNSMFTLEAGGTVIQVRGTEFSVQYKPENDWLQVVVREGEVVVTSPHDALIIRKGEDVIFKGGKPVGGPS
ncbi:MAG: hypothetical protein HKP27_10720, partial [Myxococcales bacterium]|nr:hypothetical protein [Myxococcales bacterium]